MKREQKLEGKQVTSSAADAMPAAGAKQKRLPGMADPKIPDLHEAAERYVAFRDKRQELSPLEAKAKQILMGLMHKHDKERYACDDIEIELVHEEENVKVRKVKPKKEKKNKKAAA